MNGPRPRVLVARAVFGDVLERLRAHFEVEDNPNDDIWPHDELVRRLHSMPRRSPRGSRCAPCR